ATISSVERGLGGVRLVLHGADRASAIRYAESGGHLTATVAAAVELPPLDPEAPTFVALHREVRERAAELAKKRGVPAEAVEQMVEQITEPGQLTDLVATYLDVPVADRQALLEMLAVEDRLRRVLIHVSARSRCSRHRKTSSRRSKKSSAAASARSTCASSCARSRRSSATATRP